MFFLFPRSFRSRQRSLCSFFAGITSLLVLSAGVHAADPPTGTPANTPFTFAAFGDNRPASADLPIPPVFKQIVAEVRHLHPAFVITTGDLIYGSKNTADCEKMYDEVVPLVKSIGVPVYFSPGNHEMRGVAANEDLYKKRVTDKLYYSFDYGEGASRSHFVALDTEMVGQEARIIGDQLTWLDKDLAAARAANVGHIFVYMHEPPFPVAEHIGSSLDRHPSERDAFQALLEKYKVDYLILGHEHIFDDSVHGGVHEIIAGGAGAPLHLTKRGGGFHHYVLITVDGDNVYLSVVKPGSLFAADEVLTLAPAVKATDANNGDKAE
jgi:hypothetical protein